MPEEISNIGVRLTLDASGFSGPIGQATKELNAFQQAARTAASGVGATRAGGGAAAGGTSKSAPGIGVPLNLEISAASMTKLRAEIIRGLGTIPVTISPQFASTGRWSLQNTMGAMLSGQYGLSQQQGRIAANRAIEHVTGSLPHKASGGPVQANRPIVVGEKRAEVFVPKTSGQIEPSVKDFYRRQEQARRLELQVATLEMTRQRQHEQQMSRIRGGGVGKYGSARPAPPETYVTHLSGVPPYYGSSKFRVPAQGDPGYLYHGTRDIEGVRRTGVEPRSWGDQSFWAGSGMVGWQYHHEGLMKALLRTPIRPGTSEEVIKSSAHVRPKTVPRSQLQYWGEDDAWHRFRRGRTRQDGGPADARIEATARAELERLLGKYNVPHSRLQSSMADQVAAMKAGRYAPDYNPRLKMTDDPWLPGGKYERGFMPRPGQNEVPRADEFHINLAEMRQREYRSMVPPGSRGPKAAYVATHEFGHYFNAQMAVPSLYGEGRVVSASPLDTEFNRALAMDLGIEPDSEKWWQLRRAWSEGDIPRNLLKGLPSDYSSKRPGEAEAEYLAAVERQPPKLWTPGTRHMAGVLEGFHRHRGGYAKGTRRAKAAYRPQVCSACKLVNWTTMGGDLRKQCFKCGTPLGVATRRGGGMAYCETGMQGVRRQFGGEATSLFGGSVEAMEEAAIAHFGVTDDIREAGYLTPTGKYLDFSGRHQSEGYIRAGDRWVVKPQTGTPDPFTAHAYGKDYLAGQRSIDHNEASEFMPGVDQYDAVQRMKERGFVRVWGTTATGRPGDPLHSVGAEMTRIPTSSQISKLTSAAREAEHASLDVYDPMGYRLPEGSFRTEYPYDPMGGKRMGAFLRQGIEQIEKNELASEELRESLFMRGHRRGGPVRAMGGLAGIESFKGRPRFVDPAGKTLSAEKYYGMPLGARQESELEKAAYARQMASFEALTPEDIEGAKAWYPLVHLTHEAFSATSGLPIERTIGAAATASPRARFPGEHLLAGDLSQRIAALIKQQPNPDTPMLQALSKIASRGTGIIDTNALRAAEVLADQRQLVGRKITDYRGSIVDADVLGEHGRLFGKPVPQWYTNDIWMNRMLQGQWEPSELGAEWWAARTGGFRAALDIEKATGLVPFDLQAASWEQIRKSYMAGKLDLPGTTYPQGGLWKAKQSLQTKSERQTGMMFLDAARTMGRPDVVARWGLDPQTGLPKRQGGGFVESMRGSEPVIALQMAEEKKRKAEEAKRQHRQFGGEAFYAGPGAGVPLHEPYRPEPHIRRAMDEIRTKRWEHGLSITPQGSTSSAYDLDLRRAQHKQMTEEGILEKVKRNWPFERPEDQALRAGELKNQEYQHYRDYYPPWSVLPNDPHPLAWNPPFGKSRADLLESIALGDEGGVRTLRAGPISVHSHPLTRGDEEGGIGSPHDLYQVARPSMQDMLSMLSGHEREGWVVTPGSTSIMRRTPETGKRPFLAYEEQEELFMKSLRGAGLERPGMTANEYLPDWSIQASDPLWDRFMKDAAERLKFEYMRLPTDLTKIPHGFPVERLPFDVPGHQLKLPFRNGGGSARRGRGDWGVTRAGYLSPMTDFGAGGFFFGGKFTSSPLGPMQQRLNRDIVGAPIAPEQYTEPLKWLLSKRGDESFDELWGKMLDPTRQRSFRAHRPEAGAPIVSEPWTQSEAVSREVAQQITLGRFGPKKPRLSAAGGPGALDGLYIVGEIGEELFVPNRLAGAIPKKVMDQIPKAAGGMQIIGKKRNELFAPPEDGIIVPNRLMDQVPHAQEGVNQATPGRYAGRVPGSSRFASRTDVAAAQAYAPGPPAVTGQRSLDEPTFVRLLRAAVQGVSTAGPASAPEPPDMTAANAAAATSVNYGSTADMPAHVLAALGMEAGAETAGGAAIAPTRRHPGLTSEAASEFASQRQQLSFAAQTQAARTPQGMAAVLGARFLGGRGQSLEQISAQRISLGKLEKAQAALTPEELDEYRGALDKLNTSRGVEKDAIKAQIDTMEASQTPYKAYRQAQENHAATVAKGLPGLGAATRNFGAILVGVQAYSLAMQGFGTLMSAAVPAAQKFVDQLFHWQGQATRTTTVMGEAVYAAHGNVDAVMAQTAVNAGLSKSMMDYVEEATTATAVTKAGAKAQQETSDLFRTSMALQGGGPPQGLYGGYGGLFGGGFLAEQMGGQKGFTETVAGDITALGGGTGISIPALGKPEDFGANLDLGARFLTSEGFRARVTDAAREQGNPVGVGMDVLGGLGNLVRMPGEFFGQAVASDNPLIQGAGLVGAGITSPITGPSWLLGETVAGEAPPIEPGSREAQVAAGEFIPKVLENVPKGSMEEGALNTYLADLSASADRGAESVGHLTGATYDLAKSPEEVVAGMKAAIEAGDDYGRELAEQGVIMRDHNKNVISTGKAYQQVAEDAARGKTIFDPAVWAGLQKRQLQANQQVLAEQTKKQLSVELPFQTTKQLLMQPIIEPGLGFFPGAGGKGGPSPAAAGLTGSAAGAAGRALGTSARANTALQAIAKEGLDAARAEIEEFAPENLKGFNDAAKEAQSLSNSIASMTSKMATLNRAASQANWANQIRLAQRALGDAIAMQGKAGGARLGYLERESFLINRAGQALELALRQRQITTQLALAQFQAPGQTGEERYMRQKEALAEASIAQRQLGFAKDEFAVAGQIWVENANRAAVDAAKAIEVMQKARNAEGYAIAAQEAIGKQQQRLAHTVAKMDSLLAQARGNWQGALQAAASGAGEFAGSVQVAAREIYQIMGYSRNSKGQYVKTSTPLSGALESTGYMGRHAEGYLGAFARGATFTVGEAGPETVAILRNPRTHMMQGEGGGGGGGGPVTININGPVVRDDGDISALARQVADEVERTLSRKGQMLGLRSPAY